MVFRGVYFRTQDLEAHTCGFLLGRHSVLIADEVAQLVDNYPVPPYHARLSKPGQSCTTTISEGCIAVHQISFFSRISSFAPHPFGVEFLRRSNLAQA